LTNITFCNIISNEPKGGANITLKLEQLRKKQGITQVELAHRLKVSQGAISMIENGERAPSLDLTLRIAAALDVAVDELIGKEEAS
jgi:transcriptional regulator with XRE-family HTH domain